VRADSGGPLLQRLAGSPDVMLHNIDLVRNRGLLISADAEMYRAASFLDDRILPSAKEGGWVALRHVVEAARGVPQNPALHFIFHTGHVGSSLVSRLLDESGSVLGLREPLALREAAAAHDVVGRADSLVSREGFGVLLSTLLRLWGRAYAQTPSVVLKATSSAGRIAPALLMLQPGARAIYLNLRAEPYLATLLGGANAVLDLRGHGPERVRRLIGLGLSGVQALHELSPGELAALSWLAETLAQLAACEAGGERVVSIDFDRFLEDVPGSMTRIVEHFDVQHDAAYLAGIGRSAELSRYAKAPEHPYSPQVRAQALADARVKHAGEIRKGLAWLEKTARANRLAAAAVERAGL
jgi:hypothetical protein